MEEDYYNYNIGTEHAYSVLHAEFPTVPLIMINEAVMDYWDEDMSDEQNISNCRHLEQYV